MPAPSSAWPTALRASCYSGGTALTLTPAHDARGHRTPPDAGRGNCEISADVDASDMRAAVTGIMRLIGRKPFHASRRKGHRAHRCRLTRHPGAVSAALVPGPACRLEVSLFGWRERRTSAATYATSTGTVLSIGDLGPPPTGLSYLSTPPPASPSSASGPRFLPPGDVSVLPRTSAWPAQCTSTTRLRGCSACPLVLAVRVKVWPRYHVARGPRASTAAQTPHRLSRGDHDVVDLRRCPARAGVCRGSVSA